MSKSIQIFNRQTQQMETEQVMGEGPMRALYSNPVGLQLARVLSHRWLSRSYGQFQASRRSKRAIEGFILKFKIPMNEFEERSYSSFNDFFIRSFKPTSRTFDPKPNRMPAPAEGRYFAFSQMTQDTALPIKGAVLNIEKLLGDRPDTYAFHGGPGYIARLCPVDYHRFHFPDDGKIIRQERLRGPLHSVNPIALRAKGDILFTNERVLTILETKNFGKLAYLEVGALCVGKIVQTHTYGLPFNRGHEKGYFLFGGSTVIVVGEPGAWSIDQDILTKTSQGVETLVRLGESIATSAR